MILSNVEIQNALDEGRLVLDPQPSPRSRASYEDCCPYQTSAVDLRLGDEISYLRGELPLDINLACGRFVDFFGPNCIRQQLTEDRPFVLRPGRLVLGKTLERVELPIRDDGACLAARVEGKSSYARCGLLVHFTAPTIHAGFSGTITLELINLGPLNISLIRGRPFAS